MTLRLFLYFLLLFTSVVSALAEIEIEHDRFTGSTVVRTKAKLSVGRLSISLVGIPVGPQEPPTTNILLAGAFDTWRYLHCNHTHWLIDNKPLSLPHPKHDGSVHSRLVVETLTIGFISLPQLERLAQAKKVEFKVCNDEYTATAEEMEDFRTFLAKMREHAPKK